MTERICPHCGADRWRARDAQRTYDRLSQKTRDAERLARENGLLTYQLSEQRAAVSEVQSRLQRKVVRQARAIRRMEDRLRTLGKAPYEGARSADESAPGADFDAGQVLPGEEAA